MTRWNSSEAENLLSDLECDIGRTPYVGDHYTLPAFYLRPSGTDEWVRITPFVTSPEGLEGVFDNRDVEHLEIRTDGDDRGGLQTSNESVAALYGRVVTRLANEGFSVVPNLESYF